MLVRSPNWLGDAVMCLPAIKALHKALAPDELRVLVAGGFGDLFTRYQFVSRTLAFDKKDSGAVHALLAREKYDAIWLFTNSPRSAHDASKTGCPVRVGYGGNFRAWLLTHPVPKTPNIHMVDYYLNLISPFWGGLFSQEIGFPILLSEAQFAANLPGMEDGAVGIPLGARYGPAKTWPYFNLKRLVGMLAEGGRRTVLFGTPAEAGMAAALESAGGGTVLNLTGRTTIGQMAAVMKRCGTVVANDSGPLHIAAATGAKTVAIFGPTNYNLTAPLSDNVRIVSKDVDCAPCMKRECPKDHRCMKEITAEEVYEIIEGGKKD